MPKKNNSQEYWAKRRQQDKIKVINTGENGINNLKKLLKNNLDDVEKQITNYFEKYADKKENLSPKELLAYKKKLKDAVKKVPNDKILKKLLVEDAPKYKIERLRALQTDLQLTLTEATIAQEKGIANTLDDVAKVSQSVLAKSMKDAIGLSFNTIASKKLKQILSSDWSGATWSDRLWKDREIVGKKLTDILERGMVQGTSLQTMTRELKQVTGQSFNNAFRLIRTETSHIDGQVTLEGYKQAGEELGLEYYEYDAFLDSRTSSICRELDKKRFKVSDAEVGVNYPPMHPNCRSTTQLVLDEEYKQEETEFKEMSEKSIEESKAQIDKLSLDEKKALTAYTTDDFSAINHSLRTGEKNARVEETIKNISEGLNKCSLPQNAILYRGVGTNAIENLLTKDVQNIMNMGIEKKLTEEQIKTFCGILKDKHFKDDAFISSSYNSKSAFDKPIRLNIFAKKGSKCGVIEDISIKPQEKEVLIQKGAKFKIKKAEFKNKTWILDVDLL